MLYGREGFRANSLQFCLIEKDRDDKIYIRNGFRKKVLSGAKLFFSFYVTIL